MFVCEIGFGTYKTSHHAHFYVNFAAWLVFYRKHELHTFPEHLDLPCFIGVRVIRLLVFSVLLCFCFVLLVFVLCLVSICFACLRPVSCVPMFCLSSSCVLCPYALLVFALCLVSLCCSCFSIVHSSLYLRFPLNVYLKIIK